MDKHVEATVNSYGQEPTDAWADIREIDFRSIPAGSSSDEPADNHEEREAPGRRGLLTLQDLMPRRSIKAVVGGPITFESCWRAARRHEHSKRAPELISAAVAYANLGAYAHDPGVAKAYLTRALHLVNKAKGEIDRDALNAIRASALGNLARAEMSMGNAERSAACKRAAASAESACDLRQGAHPSSSNPAVVGGRKYNRGISSPGPNAPAA